MRMTLRIGLFTVALLLASPRTWAGTVYLETYDGETSYPTSPEIDLFGAGGGVAPLGAGTPVAPTLTGTAASAAVTGVGGLAEAYETTGVGYQVGAALGSGQPVAMTGGFSGFDVVAAPADETYDYLAFGFTTMFLYKPDLSYWVSANVENPVVPGDPDYASVSVYEVQDGVVIGARVARIPISVEGIEFALQLVVDPASSLAFAGFTSGDVTIFTDPIALLAFGTERPDSLLQILGVGNGAQGTDFGPGDRAVVDFTELRVALVPEPALAWLELLAFGALALRRRQS